ncbi:MAG TPA: helix-turn-helix domain-containing protein [Reyranella sp.]|jgi:phage repressor protein C with HTH and peptisase S24 domain|nr:helix-turn-helix domain-containing protein [Reyranella sp.]
MTLGEAIRAARKAKGLTQQQLGDAFEISKSAVNMWESGKNVPDLRKLGRLIQILDLDPAVATGLAEAQASGEPAIAGRSPIMPLGAPIGRPDLPVWASAQAGDDGALVLTPDPIDYIRRSDRMTGVRDAYAFYVIGASMSPAIEHGDQVVVNPHLPVRPGNDCVFIQQGPEGMLALVKRLVRPGADQWKVRQFNPNREFELSRKKWGKAHVITEIRRGGV